MRQPMGESVDDGWQHVLGAAVVIRQLVVDGRPVCQVEVADSPQARMRGLLGRDSIDGAILLTPGASVHTIMMRFPIDVAFLDKTYRVVDVVTMVPGRIGRPRLKSRSILEAGAASFAQWGLKSGSRVEIKESSD